MSRFFKSLPVLSYVLLGCIWGSNFIYMKMASDYISATQIVLFRVFFGFIPVVGYAYYSGALKKEHLRYSFHFFVMSVLATSAYYFAFAKGTSLLLSGVAGIVSASIPLFSFLLAVCFIPEERATPNKILGVLVGIAGVALIARPSGESLVTSNLEGVLYMIAGSLSVGASFVYARKYVTPLKIPAAALVTYQLGFALLFLAAISDYSGLMNIGSDLHASLGLIVGLGLLGTGLAYIIYYYIVAEMGAVSASSVTYIPPVVALFIGAAIVKETIHLVDYVATALIFLGVYLLKRR